MKNLQDYIQCFDIETEKLMLEMAQIGNMDSKLTIYVRSNDPGNIPHFHIVDKSTLGKEFHTCIEIQTNKYFHHTGKEDNLNSKQRKELNDFLKSKHRNRSLSNWMYLLQIWNDNNSNIEVDELQTQPDYTDIKEN